MVSEPFQVCDDAVSSMYFARRVAMRHGFNIFTGLLQFAAA